MQVRDTNTMKVAFHRWLPMQPPTDCAYNNNSPLRCEGWCPFERAVIAADPSVQYVATGGTGTHLSLVTHPHVEDRIHITHDEMMQVFVESIDQIGGDHGYATIADAQQLWATLCIEYDWSDETDG